MLHRAHSASFAAAILVTFLSIPASFAQTEECREPLDLPRLGAATSPTDESTESIDFYGSIREGDAFFFCVESSANMAATLNCVRPEIKRAIQSLSSEAEFALVAYHDATLAFRTTPVRATQPNKDAARVFLNQLQPIGMPMVGPGGVELLRLANQSKAKNKGVFMVGFGHQCYPEEAIVDISFANHDAIPIHSIVVGNQEGIEFFSALSANNFGVCEAFITFGD